MESVNLAAGITVYTGTTQATIAALFFALACRAPAESQVDADDLRRAKLEDLQAAELQMRGDAAGAERLFRDALGILDRHEGSAPRLEQLLLADFGTFLVEQGRFNEADSLLTRALAAARKAFGESDAATARARLNLGFSYLSEGRLADAEELLLPAAAMLNAALPPGHADRIIAGIRVGTLYASEARFADAHSILQHAGDDALKLGDTSPQYADSLVQLAGLYRMEGNAARAEPLLRKALAIYELSGGKESPKAGLILTMLAIGALMEGKPVIAEEEARRALSILENNGGPESPFTALAKYRLAVAIAKQGRYREAQPLLEQVLAAQDRIYNGGGRAVADTLYDLAEVEASRRHYTDAEGHLLRAISLYEKAGAPLRVDLARALHRYASLLPINRTAEARALEKRAAEVERSARTFR